MARRQKSAQEAKATGATVGYEAQLWQMADALRGSMDAAEYKHVVLGLIFLKYISDGFEERHGALVAARAEGADPEDPDEYRADNIFWVPTAARWATLQAQAKQPTIGKLLDDAMVAIEADNPLLKGVLPKNYASAAVATPRLGELIDLVATIGLGSRATLWSAWWRCPASCSTPRRSQSVYGFSRGTSGRALSSAATRSQTAGATAAARHCSSTRASWARWWTASTAISAMSTLNASRAHSSAGDSM